MKLIHLKEGFRIFKKSLKRRFFGVKKYNGSAEQICRQIIKDCWNGRYFQASSGHFCEFYTRDFGFCIEALLKLGYKDEIKKTLEYVLNIFEKNRKITTTISPDGIPFDFPYYAVDSVPYLIRSLRIFNDKNLIIRYNAFLNKEIKKFYEIVFDKEKGLVKENACFSSMKDYSVRKSSCYDNVMAAMLSNELKKIEILENPFKDYDFKKTIKEKFWTGSYFLDDLSGSSHVAGDANVFPFWSNVFDDKKMLRSSIEAIQKEGLDSPFPLKYTGNTEKLRMINAEFFVPGYERSSIWMHMGPLFIGLVKKINKNKAEDYVQQYRSLIEKYKNYPEVFDADGKPYKTPFYYSDEGMLWAAMFLDLIY
ncbi:MAG: hypothetical protein Q7J54_07850 [Candidatus Woesearchaeota archaeon]|nr:hypothetical protein [Candidatus Woesearchaeota archaeon]